MFSVSAGSLLMRSVSDDVRGRAQSLYNGGFLLGSIAGPAFGGILSAISLRAPFFVYSSTLAIAGTIALVFLSEKRLGKKVDAPTSEIGQTTLSQAFRLRPYQIALMLAFINNWILFGLRSSILAFVCYGKIKLNRCNRWPWINYWRFSSRSFHVKSWKVFRSKRTKGCIVIW